MKIIKKEERERLLREELSRIMKILIEQYHPEKIILFGSLVNGKISECSDIDLLIIKDTPKRHIERCIEVAKLVHPKVGIDFFIYTPEEYKILLKERFSFVLITLKEGKVLYEKRD